MPIFVLFVSAGVLYDGVFSLWVSLMIFKHEWKFPEMLRLAAQSFSFSTNGKLQSKRQDLFGSAIEI